MLRVCYSDTAEGLRWTLFGRLAGPWVEELRASWKRARDTAPRAHAVVDLRDVTFIDEAGESLLAEMQTAGTELIAAGVDNKHMVATLQHQEKPPLRRRMVDLWTCCGNRTKPTGGEE